MVLPGMPGGSRRRGRRRGLTGSAADLLRTPVGVAVPLQRHPPALVAGASVAEMAALVGLIATGHVVALGALMLLAAVLLVLAVSNRRRVLAFTSAGVLVLTASAWGRPVGVVGPAPSDISLPPPGGLGAAVRLDGSRWWVDRSAFPRLRRARELLRDEEEPA